MIKIDKAIIVEGRYDKIKLSSVVDAPIIETGGFAVFKDKEKLAMIKALALSRGIIILTDSDSAGFVIRNYLKSAIDEKYITNIYIPEIFGKERRKAHPSKEGKLGVEGMDTELLRREFERLSIACQAFDENKRPVTTADFYDLGLCGRENSGKNRKLLLSEMGLPEYISSKAMLEYINMTMDYYEFIEKVKKILH